MTERDEVLAALRPLVRRASLLAAGGFRPPEDLRASWIGTVLVGGAGDAHPEGDDGPLHPLLQLDLTSLPHVPPGLSDLAFLTVHVDPEVLVWADEPLPAGDGWVVRTFSSLDELHPITEAAPEVGWRPFPLRSLAITDLPSWEDLDVIDPAAFEVTARWGDSRADAYEDLVDELTSVPADQPLHQVGGYPKLWQLPCPVGCRTDAPAAGDEPQFLLQLATDEKVGLDWFDAGSLFLARDAADGWLLGQERS